MSDLYAMGDSELLKGLLQQAGFEPPDNVCRACEHSGARHDLSNWCLDCPRPDVVLGAPGTRAGNVFEAHIAAGWCYFTSMSESERWAYGVRRLRQLGA